jgi:hypothetical protein
MAPTGGRSVCQNRQGEGPAKQPAGRERRGAGQGLVGIERGGGLVGIERGRGLGGNGGGGAGWETSLKIGGHKVEPHKKKRGKRGRR